MNVSNALPLLVAFATCLAAKVQPKQKQRPPSSLNAHPALINRQERGAWKTHVRGIPILTGYKQNKSVKKAAFMLSLTTLRVQNKHACTVTFLPFWLTPLEPETGR